MERREFLATIAAGASLTVAPSLLRSASAAPPPIAPLPSSRVLVVHQGDLMQAASLARRIVASLRDAGVRSDALACSAGDLADLAGIDEALRRGCEGRIVGVMDDAAAVLFQQVASARGWNSSVEVHHRFYADRVRHRLLSVSDGALAWSDSGDEWTARIAERYVDVLAGRAIRVDDTDRRMPQGNGHGQGLVSFVAGVQKNTEGRLQR